MTDVFYERQWSAPLTDDDLQAMFDDAVGCFKLHRVDWLGSLLSSDRRKLVCRFSGPDAESVRIAIRNVGGDTTRLWPGTVHDAPDAAGHDWAQANVVVGRRFDQPVALEDVQAIEDDNIECLRMHRVRFVRTYFARDRRRMVCLYEAPDAESVRVAQRRAGMPFESVWSFQPLLPPQEA